MGKLFSKINFEFFLKSFQNTLFLKIAKNFGWLFFDKISRMIISVIVGSWTARYLGPERYGELAYAISFALFFQTAANLGIDALVVGKLSESKVDKESILGVTLRLRIFAAILSIFLALVLIALLRPNEPRAMFMVFIIVCGSLFQSAETIDLWFQSQIQSRKTVIAKLSAYLISSLLRVLMILNFAPVEIFAVVYLFEFQLTAAFLYFIYKKEPTERKWKWDGKVATLLLKDGWPYLLSALSVVLYMRIDQLMLARLASVKELGMYSAMLPLSTAWNFIPVIVCSSILPVFVETYARSTSEFDSKLFKLFLTLTWLAIGISVAMYFASEYLINFLLGEKYASYSSILSVHVLTNIFLYLGVAQNQWIIAAKKGKLLIIRTTAGAFISIASNAVLIPIHGALGAAWAAVLTQLFSAVILNLLVARKIFYMQISALFPVIVLFKKLSAK
ncbi:hypothetical protein os1_10690 [Comamonadaceae bacterium OS-1]|nr:hypothetical protein os1_10690 [Comamonadaceae bacterium OS-1]